MDDPRLRVMVSVDLQLLGPGTYVRRAFVRQETVWEHVSRPSRMSPEDKASDTLQLAYRSPSKLLQVRLEELRVEKRRVRKMSDGQRRLRNQEEAVHVPSFAPVDARQRSVVSADLEARQNQVAAEPVSFVEAENERVMVSVDLQLLGPSTYMCRASAQEEDVTQHVSLRSRMSVEEKVLDTLSLAHRWPFKLLQIRREERRRSIRLAHNMTDRQRRARENEARRLQKRARTS